MNNNIWQGIYGQETVKKVLGNIIKSGKIPHAFLFQGPAGVGKDYIAVRFAEALTKTIANNPTEIHSLSQIRNLAEPYIKFIFPLPRGKNEIDTSGPTEKLSNDEMSLIQEELNIKIRNPYHKITVPRAFNIKISSIRDIKKFLAFDFEDITWRFIIISEAHLMNEEAQNALLKSLEEPPEGVVFILTTNFPVLLRETIRSRSWTINFQPLSNGDIEKILVEYFGNDLALSQKIAPFAAGSVRNALNFIENDFENLLDKTILILRYSFGKKYNSALDQFSPYIKDNSTESMKIIIQLIIIWLNDFQKYRLGYNEYFFKDFTETLEKFHKRFPNLEVTETTAKLDYMASILQNNINLNIVAIKIIFELSSLVTFYKNI